MKPERDYQKNFYRSFARIRERDKRINRAAKIKWILERQYPGELPEAICVDVGCSAGIITAEVSSIVKMAVGVDYDPTGLSAIAQTDKVKAHFVHTDALRLPFSDASVEICICAQVYEHVPDDNLLVEEIYRILKPGGLCFFSGPNWLFPIEPHYFLPFLHWLPESLADVYLRVMGNGTHYYERSRTLWGLRRLLNRFEIFDVTLDVLLNFYLANNSQGTWFLKIVPLFVWKMLLPVFPNFNWLLRKDSE